MITIGRTIYHIKRTKICIEISYQEYERECIVSLFKIFFKVFFIIVKCVYV